MNRLNFNGRVNSVNGIRYRYSGKSNILSLYIDDIQHKKKKIRAEMSPDANHRCPHIHIKGHEASEGDNADSRLLHLWLQVERCFDCNLAILPLPLLAPVGQPVPPGSGEV